MLQRCALVIVLVLVFALAGCGDDGDGSDSEPDPSARASDLSGDWKIARADCEGDFSDRGLRNFESDLLRSDPDSITQFDNVLEIVNRSWKRLFIGAIKQDEVYYEDELWFEDFSIVITVEGTVRSSNRIVATAVYEFYMDRYLDVVECEIDSIRLFQRMAESQTLAERLREGLASIAEQVIEELTGS